MKTFTNAESTKRRAESQETVRVASHRAHSTSQSSEKPSEKHRFGHHVMCASHVQPLNDASCGEFSGFVCHPSAFAFWLLAFSSTWASLWTMPVSSAQGVQLSIAPLNNYKSLKTWKLQEIPSRWSYPTTHPPTPTPADESASFGMILQPTAAVHSVTSVRVWKQDGQDGGLSNSVAARHGRRQQGRSNLSLSYVWSNSLQAHDTCKRSAHTRGTGRGRGRGVSRNQERTFPNHPAFCRGRSQPVGKVIAFLREAEAVHLHHGAGRGCGCCPHLSGTLLETEIEQKSQTARSCWSVLLTEQMWATLFPALKRLHRLLSTSGKQTEKRTSAQPTMIDGTLTGCFPLWHH